MSRARWIATILLLLTAPASAQERSRTPVVVSLLYPISTNQDPNVRTNLGASLLYGNVGAVHGIDVNGIASRTRGDVVGVHWTTGYSRIDGNFAGVLLAPGGSWVRGNAAGAQLALIALVDRGNARGFMFSGALNMVNGNFGGFQMAVAANIVDKNATGLVLTGFGNIVGGDFKGISFSSGYNYVAGRSAGLQFGAVNFAGRARGGQFGIANFARDARGLQIGIVNYADHQGGVPLGMVNVAGSGKLEGVAYSSNLARLNVGVRTEVHHISSMLTLGTFDRVGDVHTTAILTWNLGVGIPLTRGADLILDGGLAHYMPEHTSDPTDNDRLHYGLQARALIEANLGPHLRLLAGGGLSRVYESYESGAASASKPLYLAGLGVR